MKQVRLGRDASVLRARFAESAAIAGSNTRGDGAVSHGVTLTQGGVALEGRIDLRLGVSDGCRVSRSTQVLRRHVPHHLDTSRAIGVQKVRMRVVNAAVHNRDDHSLAGDAVLGKSLVVLRVFVDHGIGEDAARKKAQKGEGKEMALQKHRNLAGRK